MGPVDLETSPRSIGFDADENGQSRQARHKIPIAPVGRFSSKFNVLGAPAKPNRDVLRSALLCLFMA
jgi:hypothetical protein